MSHIHRATRLSRRTVLTSATAAGLGALAAPRPAAARSRGPFTLGVASGDPTPDGVVLWTRLAPDPFAPDGGMPDRPVLVEWQVAHDDRFARVVRAGTVFTTADRAHAVHVEVAGLAPARWYHYRFRVGRHISPTGRTRTAPAPWSSPAALAFAVASCQDWQNGYFAAYRHISEEDLDLVVHLGDYIYEGEISAAGTEDTPGYVRAELPPEPLRAVPRDLTQYRLRHALYRSDPQLQAAHAAAPWALTWDDHEVAPNWGAYGSAEPDESPAEFALRLAAARRAYYEHLPLRAASAPRPGWRLYRRLTFGDLLQLNLTDTRSYRTAPDRANPKATVLGEVQESWLLAGLAASPARWNVVTAQVLMAQLDLRVGPGQAFSTDKWDGYPYARRRLLTAVHDRGVRNPVVLSGDAHVTMVNDLKLDFDDPSAATVATEFLGTAIASRGNTLAEQDVIHAHVLPESPHIRFYEGYHRGYLTCRLDRNTWRTELRAVDTSGWRGQVASPDAGVRTRAAFVVEDGRPGATSTATPPH
ncbi:alkaline phosphatase D family protein [Actinomycetes bacterium KLBMP 9797]